jgi:hypothetical protein
MVRVHWSNNLANVPYLYECASPKLGQFDDLINGLDWISRAFQYFIVKRTFTWTIAPMDRVRNFRVFVPETCSVVFLLQEWYWFSPPPHSTSNLTKTGMTGVSFPFPETDRRGKMFAEILEWSCSEVSLGDPGFITFGYHSRLFDNRGWYPAFFRFFWLSLKSILWDISIQIDKTQATLQIFHKSDRVGKLEGSPCQEPRHRMEVPILAVW